MKHTGETTFNCEHCPQGYRDKRRLTAHLLAHHKNAGVYKKRGTGDFSCPECSGIYQHFQHLLRHMRRVHSKQKADTYKKLYYSQKYGSDSTPVVGRQRSPSSKRTSIGNSPKTRLNSRVKPISPKKFYKNLEISKPLIENSIKDVSEVKEGEANESNEWKCDFKACLRSYSSKCNLKRHQMEIHKKLSKPLFYRNTKIKDAKYFIPKPSEIADDSPKKKKKPTENTAPTVPKTASKGQPTEGTAKKAFSCNYKSCPNSYYTISGLYKHKKNVHMSKTDWSSVAQKATKFQNSTSVQNQTELKSSGASKKSESSLLGQNLYNSINSSLKLRN